MSKASAQGLKADLKRRSEQMKAKASTALESAAQELAGAIRGKARIQSGNLARSVEAVRHGSGWRVQAGGDLTTREVRAGSGKSYDYARANEFGTVEQKANPFFFNTVRAKKGGIKRRVTKAMSDGMLD